jgi:sec-independent protein translocase protein TatA
MFGLRGTEIIIIALVILLLFGGKKIPELMRGIGKGVKGFKDGLNGAGDEPAPEENSGADEAK